MAYRRWDGNWRTNAEENKRKRDVQAKSEASNAKCEQRCQKLALKLKEQDAEFGDKAGTQCCLGLGILNTVRGVEARGADGCCRGGAGVTHEARESEKKRKRQRVRGGHTAS